MAITKVRVGKDPVAPPEKPNPFQSELARSLLQGGLQTGPVQSTAEGFARLAQAGVGAFLNKQLQDKQKKFDESRIKATADFLLPQQQQNPMQDIAATLANNTTSNSNANEPTPHTGGSLVEALDNFKSANSSDTQQASVVPDDQLLKQGDMPLIQRNISAQQDLINNLPDTLEPKSRKFFEDQGNRNIDNQADRFNTELTSLRDKVSPVARALAPNANFQPPDPNSQAGILAAQLNQNGQQPPTVQPVATQANATPQLQEIPVQSSPIRQQVENALRAGVPPQLIQQRFNPQSPFGKINPKDFTPESLSRFGQTRNYGDLRIRQGNSEFSNLVPLADGSIGGFNPQTGKFEKVPVGPGVQFKQPQRKAPQRNTRTIQENGQFFDVTEQFDPQTGQMQEVSRVPNFKNFRTQSGIDQDGNLAAGVIDLNQLQNGQSRGNSNAFIPVTKRPGKGALTEKQQLDVKGQVNQLQSLTGTISELKEMVRVDPSVVGGLGKARQFFEFFPKVSGVEGNFPATQFQQKRQLLSTLITPQLLNESRVSDQERALINQLVKGDGFFDTAADVKLAFGALEKVLNQQLGALGGNINVEGNGSKLKVGESISQLPNAAEFDGQRFVDDATGKIFKSQGGRWVEQN